jgi:hypothetical protein
MLAGIDGIEDCFYQEYEELREVRVDYGYQSNGRRKYQQEDL